MVFIGSRKIFNDGLLCVDSNDKKSCNQKWYVVFPTGRNAIHGLKYWFKKVRAVNVTLIVEITLYQFNSVWKVLDNNNRLDVLLNLVGMI